MLKVDLKERNVDFPVRDQIFRLELFKTAEDKLKTLRYNTLTRLIYLTEDAHRVRLARTSLPIDEVRAIVAIQHVHDKRQGRLLKHLQLRRVRSKDWPEHKIVLSCLFRSNVEGEHLALVGCEFDTSDAIRVVLLTLWVGTIIAIEEGVRLIWTQALEVFEGLDGLQVLYQLIVKNGPHSDVNLNSFIDCAMLMVVDWDRLLILLLERLERVLVFGHGHGAVGLLATATWRTYVMLHVIVIPWLSQILLSVRRHPNVFVALKFQNNCLN